MIRTIWFESELAPLTGQPARRMAFVDFRGRQRWSVICRARGPRGGKKRGPRHLVTSLKQAKAIASAWVNSRELTQGTR